MARIALIRPPLEVDPVFDPVRAAALYSWQRLIQSLPDHEVVPIDAVTEGIDNKRLYRDGFITDMPYEEFIVQRNQDLMRDKPEWFLEKYDLRYVLRVGKTMEDIIKDVDEASPDVIGITSFTTREHLSTLRLARSLGQAYPSTPIVVGGVNASYNSEQLLRDSHGSIDYVFLGAGEQTLRDFLNGYVPETGIAYIESGDYISKGPATSTFMTDGTIIDPKIVDRLSQPAKPNYVIYPPEVNKYTEFMFSEGCPGRCGFCIIHDKEGMYREMPPDALEEQLDLFRENGYNYLVIENNEFCIPSAEALALRFIESAAKRGVQWTNNGGLNLDILSEKMVDRICDSSCFALAANFNPRRIDQTKTTNDLNSLFRKLKRLTDAGVRIYTSVMIGTPYQTRHDIRFEINTLAKLVEENIVTFGMIFCLSYLPGTEYTRRYGHLVYEDARYTGQSIFVPQAGTQTGLKRKDIAFELVRGLRRIWEFSTYWGHLSPISPSYRDCVVGA